MVGQQQDPTEVLGNDDAPLDPTGSRRGTLHPCPRSIADDRRDPWSLDMWTQLQWLLLVVQAFGAPSGSVCAENRMCARARA